LPATASPFAPFRNRRYLVYWLTGLSANFGWLIQLVGASWLMTSIGGGPELVALVQTAVALPIMLFSLPAGAISDALGRRTMVLWSQSFLLVVSTMLAVFAWMEVLTPWLLLAFTFLVGSGKALNNPGWQTMVSELMPREELPPAIAMNSVGFNIARSVGPAIGGVIVAAIGAFAAFAVNAVANLGVIFVARRWPKPVRDRNLPPETVGAAMMAGLRYVALSPTLLLVILRGAVFNFTAIAVMALMPLVARDLLQGGPQVFGFLLGAFGVGAVIGALNIARLKSRLSLEALVRIAFVSFAVATATMALSGNQVLSMLASALAGASWLMAMSTFNTTVQMSSPRWVLSRCHAIYQGAAFGANAMGALVWGVVASSVGTDGALIAAAVALIAGAALGLIMSLRELETLGLDPHAPWTPPQPSIDMVRKSGPILTTIEYRIRQEDVPEFLAMMTERRRQRIQDGARRWTLARDIQNPESWIESYKTPTWMEHERFHSRRTVAGAQIGDRIRELHQGPEKPRVRYALVRHPASTMTEGLAPIVAGVDH